MRTKCKKNLNYFLHIYFKNKKDAKREQFPTSIYEREQYVQPSGLLRAVCVQCDSSVIVSVSGMTQSVNIVLKFPMYNTTKVAPE